MSKHVVQPKVSVVIPTYNRADKLRRTLDSLMRQTINDFEVVICDDGSTDETADVVNEYSPLLDITYDFSDNYGGPARPRNRGVKLARAPYIAFLDSDDWWSKKKLEVSLEYMNEGADIVYHDLFYVTKSDQNYFWRKVTTRDLSRPVFNDLLRNGNLITNSSVVLRKNLLEKINGFNEDKEFIAIEDYDAWLRIAKYTDKFKRIPQTLGFYWGGGGNISNSKRMLININAFEKCYFNSINILGDVYWLDYAAGKAYMNLKSYHLAINKFSSIGWEKTPLSIYFRSKLLMWATKLNYIFTRKWQ